MTHLIYVLNGPNLNMLGLREPAIYGRDTLDDIKTRCAAAAKANGLVTDFRQSNVEGELVNWIQEARSKAQGIILNAGGYTHTSVAILDALQAAELPVIQLIFRTSSAATSSGSILTFHWQQPELFADLAPRATSSRSMPWPAYCKPRPAAEARPKHFGVSQTSHSRTGTRDR